jgi:alpha-beta hydrolase superfamily lysophospholipase
VRERATHLWFGPEPAPLAGWLHEPSGDGVRGGVVLCPPFGREEVACYRALRSLADLLATAGFAVLRFDYQGTGDSANGLAGSDELDSWVSSVREAVALLRDAGVPWLGAVGLRLGAIIAARADGGTLDSLVLWDPCWSGRSFLRGQELLHRLTLGGLSAGSEADHEAGALEIPGVSLSAATNAGVRSLDLARELDAWPRERSRLCLITREGDQSRSAHAEVFEPRSSVDQYTVTGQEAMLERPPLTAEVPASTLEVIATYLATRAPEARARLRTSTRVSATVGRTPSGSPIVERAVQVGNGRLFGLFTELGGRNAVGVVVLCNPAAEHHVGPSRQWVELARRWAAVGVRTLRFDGAGTGDSPAVDIPVVAEDRRFYTDAAVRDVVEAIRFASPEEPRRVVVIGLCTGAWLAAMAARQLGVRGAVLMNQVVWDEEGRAVPFPSGPGGPEEVPLGDHPPGTGRHDPLPLLRSLSLRGVDTTVLLGSVEHQGFLEAADPGELADLTSGGAGQRGGKVAVRRLDQFDHTLLTRPARRVIADELSSIVLDQFEGDGAPSASRTSQR